MDGSGDTTQIGRLRIRAAGPDPLLVQLRAARLLNTVQLQPAGLPSSAVLCIRHLRDPLPRALNLHRSDLHQPNPAWRQALTTRIEQLARRAVRPAHDTVPANADAVLFADRSELLACLAADWISGQTVTHWWWQSLFKNRAVTPAVLTTWLDAPEYAPAALDHLAARRQVIPFVGALPADCCQTLLQRIIHCFGLTTLSSALDIVEPETGVAAINAVIASNDAGRATSAAARLTSPATVTNSIPPWQRWVPEGGSGQLSLEQRCLLGIGLMVQRAPTIVRTSAFAVLVQQWRQPADPLDQRAIDAHQAVSPSGVGLLPDAVEPPVDAKPITPMLADAHTLLDGVTASAEAVGEPQPTPQVVGDEQASPPSEQEFSTPKSGAEQFVEKTINPEPTAPAQPEDAITSKPASALPTSSTIDTAYGGLFYLINLGIYLELYADFTAPLTPGIELNIYDFVALVGERLLGEALCADPIWPLLTELAGRSSEQPAGQDFAPPAGQSLAAWLDTQMVVIRARLVQALELEETPEMLPTLLCVHQARVVASATHLDIFLVLAALPIAIRLSGLDRNPGWVPAAGRYITFYFE